MALTYDTLASTTFHLIRKRLADAIFKSNPFSAYLLMRGRVKTEPGGTEIREPLIYAVNNTVKSYSGYDRLNVTPTEELTSAVYQWKLLAGSISISGEEELKNNGPAAVFKMLQVKADVLEKSMRQRFNEMFLQKVGLMSAKDFLSLDALVENSGTFGTVGGIDSNTYTWWQNHHTSIALSTTTVTDELRKFYHNVSQGIERPDLFLMPQTYFETYEKENATKQVLSDTRLLDAGFENLKFKGVTMMWDPMMEDSTLRDATDVKTIYGLNTNYLSVTLHARRNFVMTPFQKPYDQDARVAQMFVAGNLTCSNRRFQGALVLT